MKKFEGILLCTDLDGTLLRNDKSISKENLKAIRYFMAEGGKFTFITGRMPYFVQHIYDTLNPNAPFGCINGGGIYDHRLDKYVWTRELSPECFELIDSVVENVKGIGLQVNTFDKIYFSMENDAMAYFREVTGVPNLVKPYREVKEPIGKIVFGDNRNEIILEIEKTLLSHPKAWKFDFIRSEHALYEILPKGNSKGDVMMRIADLLGIDRRRTVAAGDYNNDVSMLRDAGVGVAVSNASPAAKAAADCITVSNEEHAIAKIIKDIEEGKIRFTA
ncbi:MAG: Cof-type HAD-IIB family hydrolase [Clostridia bacterium]|nr:Cof-type HAD-IIB family hydrolase [Clostridia bacterium]